MGRINSGKSFASNVFKDYGFEVRSFANPLKSLVLNMFPEKTLCKKIHRQALVLVAERMKGSITSKKFFSEMERCYGFTSQHVMNHIEEFLSELDSVFVHKYLLQKEFWLELLFQDDYDNIVIDDLRFTFEAEKIRSLGGYIVLIDCPQEVCLDRMMLRDNSSDSKVFENEFEKDWPKIKPDFTINSNQPLELYEADLRRLAIYLTNTTGKRNFVIKNDKMFPSPPNDLA